MKLRILIAALLVAGSVAAVGGAIARGGSGDSQAHRWGTAAAGSERGEAPANADAPPGAVEFTLIEVFDGEDVGIDVGEEGFSPGDYNVFHDSAYDETETTKLGQLHVTCLFLFDRDLCRGTIDLKKGELRGKITFDGSVPKVPFLLAITGGTGDFRLARGQLRLQPIRDDAFRIDVQVFLS